MGNHNSYQTGGVRKEDDVTCDVLSHRLESCEIIGSGLFGKVVTDFNCKDHAVKVIPFHMVEDDDIVYEEREFERELEALGTVGQAGLGPKLIDAWICGDKGYIVMEKLHGVTLKEFLRKHNLTPEEQKVLQRTIGAMNSLGVIHNDLHTGNVFIVFSPKGLKFYIMDFGESETLTNRESFDKEILHDSIQYRLEERPAYVGLARY